MKNSLRKGLIATLTAFFAIMIAFAIFTNVNFVKADAIAIPDDANAPRVTGEWTDDFYVIDGASVRLETEGLKFTTVVSKAYMQELTSGGATVEFFATAKKAGGTAKAVTYKYQPEVATMSATVNLNTYLNFDNVSDEDMATACATDFIIETYAKITNGNEVSYVRAYKPENNDISRSMQVVANAYYLESGDANLKAYFYEGNRSATDTGYVSLEDGSSKFTMPKVELEGTVNAYVGTKKYTGTVDADGKLVLSGLDVENVKSAEKVNVSIFNGNTVYSTKLVAADMALTAENISILHDISDKNMENDETVKALKNAYFVLADDVDMSTVSWPTYAYIGSGGFQGTLDGQGYAIKNFSPTYNNGYLGSFLAYTENSTFKNFAMTNVSLPRFSTPIATRAKNVTFENVSITVNEILLGGGAYGNNSGLVALNNGNLTLKDVYIKLPELATYATSTNFISTHTHGKMTLDNVAFVGGTTSTGVQVPINATMGNGVITNENLTNITGVEEFDYKFFKTEAIFYSDVQTGVFNPTDLVENYLRSYTELKTAYNFVEIRKSNITDLRTATNEYFVLVEDIDMSDITWEAYPSTGYNDATSKFVGTFDGLGHTISNFSTSGGNHSAGLFRHAESATVRNLFMTDVTISSSSTGIITGRCGNDSTKVPLTLENVVIKVKNMTAGCAIGAASYGIALKNVIIDLSAATGGKFLALTYSRRLATENVYFIGTRDNDCTANRIDNEYSESGITKFDSYNNFASAEKTLTTFLTNAVAKVYGN